MTKSSVPDRARLNASLKEMVRRILVTGHPQKIILFGSRARGDARPDSDYDLLLIEPSDQSRDGRAIGPMAQSTADHNHCRAVHRHVRASQTG